MDLGPLLSILSDGEYISGVALGQKLGVSRTAIWKMMGKIEELGIDVDCIKGKGYRVGGGLDLLDRDIAKGLSCSDTVAFCDVLLDVESTNSYLMEKVARHALARGEFGFCLAERQTRGRGRRGRLWVSPFGQNIYLSGTYFFPGEVSRLTGLSLSIGIATAELLNEMGVPGVELKWPNDLMIGGRKLGGILVELSGEITQGCMVLIGIGLNVGMRESEVSTIDQPWTSLVEEGVSIPRSRLAANLIEKIVATVSRFNESGFVEFFPLWQKYDYLKGKPVTVPGGDLAGIGAGINDSGELLIQSEGKMVSVNAGEVSVRVSTDSD